MRQIPFGAVVPILILLLSIISCDLFSNAPKPTQVVDLPSMVGKSFQEMTTMLGPSKELGICYGWDLPEGELSVCYQSGDNAKKLMKNLSYRLTPYSGLFPHRGVGSPEEMAALVKIDIEGRKPDNEFRGGYAYNNFNMNGKKVYVAFDGGPKRIVGVTVFLE